VIAANPDISFTLLGNTSDLKKYEWTQKKNISIKDFRAPIFSIREQFMLMFLIPRKTTLFWSPHFNIPLFYRGRLLVTIYDVFHLAMPELVGGLHKRLYARVMFTLVRLKADAILTISNFTKGELNRLAGCKKDLIFPIHLGVDSTWFSQSQSVSPHGRPYLLFVGNVKPNKNLVTLMDAFALLINKTSHDLIIIGKKEGFITGDNEVISRAANLNERIHFTGYVSESLLREYVRHADIFVFPSLYEGFGLPPLEAMASGCPVIVSRSASLPEVCGDAALYCDPYDAHDIAKKIESILINTELREKLGKNGPEYAKLFTWEKCAEETLLVIKKIAP
jgi:glycosyltransferase involved in cell wall biosynthesis